MSLTMTPLVPPKFIQKMPRWLRVVVGIMLFLGMLVASGFIIYEVADLSGIYDCDRQSQIKMAWVCTGGGRLTVGVIMVVVMLPIAVNIGRLSQGMISYRENVGDRDC